MGFLSKSPLEEAAWARATALREFTHVELAGQLQCDQGRIGEFVRGWERLAWVERIDDRIANATFRVLQGAGPEPAGTGSREGNMWRAMRGLPAFSAIDIAAHADTAAVSVTADEARAYIGVLFRHDYLRCIRKADPSKGREAVYKLVRNTGPKAPVLRRIRAVLDPNLGQFVLKEGKL